MIKILSESGHERNRNAGDEAYFAAMVDLFRRHIVDVQITAFSDRPEHDMRRYAVCSVYSGGSLVKTLKSLNDIYRAIRSCDLYVWGAGQILRDDTHILAPAYRLFRPLLAKLSGKPVIAYAVGIGPLDTWKAQLLTRLVLNRFDMITYRDAATGKILERIGVTHPPIHRTVDPAFDLSPEDEMTVKDLMNQLGLVPEKFPLMGIAAYGPAYRGSFRGIRSILPASYQADKNIWPSGHKEKYARHVEILANAYDYMVENHAIRPIFIVQDASGQGLDARITDDILKKMRHSDSAIRLMADDYSPALLKGLMGRMEMVTGGRMHSLILASGAFTPIHAICYEEKIKAFGAIIGMENYFIDGYRIKNADELIQSLEQTWHDRAQIRAQLKPKIEKLKKTVNENVLFMTELLHIKQ